MDEKRSAVQPGHQAKPRRIPADGVIGRLTYIPALGDEGIGQIRGNRAKDETPHFKQVTSFAQWCPPNRTSPQPSEGRPSQVARSQKNWLLDHFPEASILDGDTECLLLDEVTTSQHHTPEAPADTAALFAVGEVTDLRQSDSNKGHSVLAVASGVSGNVLRLISLIREEWIWTDADIRVRLHAADDKLGGEWCPNAVPISLIKFAADARKQDPIRWLLVSNGVSATVYEPELRMIPMPAAEISARFSGRPAASQIVGNPLFRIPCDRTGGSLLADVCFTRHPEADTPQLAIVDQAGCWSLWEITGRRNARPKVLSPVMMMRGSSVLGSIPKLPATSVTEAQLHKVFWLSLGKESEVARSRSVSRTRSPTEGSEMSVDADQPQPPRRLLLISSLRALSLFDLASQKLHSVAHLVLPKDTHRILGVAPSRLAPNQAFVLTNTSLFWVAVTEGKKGILTLNILASCPHQKDVNDPTLRLDVSPGAYVNGLMACFVCVRSTKNTEMTVFWFINPRPGAPVRYQRDFVSMKGTPNFVGLTILPAGRRTGGEPKSAAGRAMHKAGLRFFQMLTLGQDLSVHRALCAWSDEPGLFVPPPDIRETLGDNRNRRLKLLQSLTDAFAVPDEFDERAVFGKDGSARLSLERLKGGIEQRVDFSLVAQRMAAVEEDEGGDEDGRVSPERHMDFGFIAKAVEWERVDGYMPRHSLLELAASHATKAGFLELAREWDAQQEALHRRAEDWLFVPEARRPLIDFGPDDLVERLRYLFLDLQPSGQGAARERREKVLQTMAAEMFLSNIGVSAMPPSWTATETQVSGSLPFPSSPSLMSSQPSLPSSRKNKGKAKEESEEDRGDAAALRLRKYAKLKTSPTTNGEPVIALSRWDLGADPDEITWKPGQDLEAEDAINRRRRKIEARRRKAERLSQRIFGEDSFLNQSSQSFGILPSTQPLPTILSTGSQGLRDSLSQSQTQSQTQTLPQTQSQQIIPPWDFSSQPPAVGAFGSPRVFPGSPLRREFRRDSGAVHGFAASSQPQLGTPSQPKSQVLPGLFGGRPSFSPFKRSPVKKVKRKSELRMSGFR